MCQHCDCCGRATRAYLLKFVVVILSKYQSKIGKNRSLENRNRFPENHPKSRKGNRRGAAPMQYIIKQHNIKMTMNRIKIMFTMLPLTLSGPGSVISNGSVSNIVSSWVANAVLEAPRLNCNVEMIDGGTCVGFTVGVGVWSVCMFKLLTQKWQCLQSLIFVQRSLRAKKR